MEHQSCVCLHVFVHQHTEAIGLLRFHLFFFPYVSFWVEVRDSAFVRSPRKKKVGAPLRLSIVARAPNVREISARSVRLPRHLLRKGYDCTFVVCCVFIFDEDPHLEELFLYLTPTP